MRGGRRKGMQERKGGVGIVGGAGGEAARVTKIETVLQIGKYRRDKVGKQEKSLFCTKSGRNQTRTE